MIFRSLEENNLSLKEPDMNKRYATDGMLNR